MEIKFSGKEVEAIILREAQKLCPGMNKVRGENYRSTPDLTVSFEAPVEPAPESEQALHVVFAETDL